MFLINQSDGIKNVSSFLKNRRFSRRRFFFLKLNFCFLVALLALVPVTGCSDKNINQANTTRHPSNEIPQRIISTVPSITETLFALDLQNRLVGVSDFCHYPPEADKIRKVGGYFDPNLEAMLELEPDLVLILKENQDLRRRLESLGINVLTVDHSSITGILESFEQIGAVFGDDFQAKGHQIREDLENRVQKIRAASGNSSHRPSVLISIDRVRGTGKVSDIYAAGNNPYFNEILEIVGARNILQDSSSPVPTISAEGILELNPEFVIDLTTTAEDKNEQEIKKDWECFGNNLQAVQKKQIFPISDDFATIPGPRFILLIEKLNALFHPDK